MQPTEGQKGYLVTPTPTPPLPKEKKKKTENKRQKRLCVGFAICLVVSYLAILLLMVASNVPPFTSIFQH